MNELINELSHEDQQHKKELEQTIIGAVLLEADALPKVADILSHKSFGGVRSDIWRVITEMYGHSPVDLRTVNHALRQQKIICHLELTECISRVNSAANIRTHAMLLLELDITRHFLEIYSSCKHDKRVETMAEEIIESLNHGDRLKTIRDATAWFAQIMPEAEISKKLLTLNKAIHIKVDRMRKAEKVHQLTRSLSKLTSSNPEHDHLVNELTDALVMIMNAKKLPYEVSEIVYSLKPAINNTQTEKTPF